jgi:hypothetical protein
MSPSIAKAPALRGVDIVHVKMSALADCLRREAGISDPNVAGGREINPAAFTLPTGAVQGDLGRNALRGFGATQVDLTLRRQFKLHGRLALQARADFFNIFNHPNFGPPINSSVLLHSGNRRRLLGASVGSGGQNGGLNPLYQIGGPRSVQMALKFPF